MNIKSKLAISLSAITLVVGTACFATSNITTTLIKADEDPSSQFLSLVLDADTPFENNVFTLTSAKGNTFHFDTTGITIRDGVIKMGRNASIRNREALHGIDKVEFTNPYGTVQSKYKIDESNSWSTAKTNEIADTGYASFNLSSANPAYFDLSVESTQRFEFSQIKLNYSCSALEGTYGVSKIATRNIREINCNFEGLFVQQGTNLNDISLENVEFYLGDDFVQKITDNSQITNLSVKYTDDTNKDSTTVVYGEVAADISFTYDGINYSASSVAINGYRTTNCFPTSLYLTKNTHVICDNNNIPEDFTVTVLPRIMFFGQYGPFKTLDGDETIIPLTNENTTFDVTESFTTTGVHHAYITVLDSSSSRDCMFTTFDPDAQAAQYIFAKKTLTFLVGTTTEEFYEYIQDVPMYKGYQSSGSDCDVVTYLTGDDFILYDGMFDYVSQRELLIPKEINSPTSFEVVARRGNLTETYTSSVDGGIASKGLQANVSSIALFDNNCVQYDGVDRYYSYSIDGNVLTVYKTSSPNYNTFDRFNIDTANKTFSEYVETREIRYENLEAYISGSSEPSYKVTIFEDGIIQFEDINEYHNHLSEVTFTEEPLDNLVIYFDGSTIYNFKQLKGTIDVQNNRIDIVPVE